MGKYDTMQVCTNGHLITSLYYSYPELRKQYCTTCSASTIKACPSCEKDIQGRYQSDEYIDLTRRKVIVPKICKHCGAYFLWHQEHESIAGINAPKGETQIAGISEIDRIIYSFDSTVRQLRHRHGDRETLDVKDEYDVQDLLHALLHLYFDDIREEEYTPSNAGGASRSDFILKEQQIVIEVKMTRRGLTSKKLGEELIIDISRYSTHPQCKTLFCFIYDPEKRIKNPRGIERDLQKDRDGEMKVIVRIVP